MGRLGVLISLGLICVASTMDTVVDPRGARPVEHGTRSEKCASQKDWPFCTDDDWGSKCPSGCRIMGLMNRNDHNALKRVKIIRDLLDQYKAKHRSADQVSKQTYDFLRDRLTTDTGSDNTYYDLAQNLRQSITDMKIRIDRQLRVLAALKDRVKDQVTEMQRLEVDIDIKLRSCKGSCQRYTQYQVDQESYVTLEKQINQLDSRSSQNIETVRTLYVMKSRPLQDVVVDSVYKSKDETTRAAAQQKDDLFTDVKTLQLMLEEEGSSSSPATISKVPVCLRLMQQTQDGRQPPRPTWTYRSQRCVATPAVALCSDDDWVSKCPSGCRLQGLISQMESEVERKLQKVCKTRKMHEDAADVSMMATTQIYTSLSKNSRQASNLKFVEHVGGLARSLTSLRRRSSCLSQKLKELRSNVEGQIEDLYRSEVDVDMKLRACRGSCRSAPPFSVSHPSYQTLRTDLDQMDKTGNQRSKGTAPQRGIPHVKLRTVDVGPAPSTEYRTMPTVQGELLTQFVLEELLEEPADVECPVLCADILRHH